MVLHLKALAAFRVASSSDLIFCREDRTAIKCGRDYFRAGFLNDAKNLQIIDLFI